MDRNDVENPKEFDRNGRKTAEPASSNAESSYPVSEDAFKNAGWELRKSHIDDAFRIGQPETTRQAAVTAPLNTSENRSKSALRMRYEAEVQVIQRKLGGLESMRETLGLSQRKICQLLLVDPSAWTRWTKGGEDAPPHIYRMLQWYLALQEKYPALDANFWLSAVAKVREPVETQELQTKTRELSADYEALKAEVANLQRARDAASDFEEQILRAERRTNLRDWWILVVAVFMSLVAGFISSHYFR